MKYNDDNPIFKDNHKDNIPKESQQLNTNSNIEYTETKVANEEEEHNNCYENEDEAKKLLKDPQSVKNSYIKESNNYTHNNNNSNSNINNSNPLETQSHKRHSLLKHESTVVSIEITSETTTFDLYKGIFFMFFSCLAKSVYSVLLKYTMNSNNDLTPYQVMAWRTFILLWIVSFVYLVFHKSIKIMETTKTEFNLVMGRSFLAVISTPFLIVSLKYLSISEVYSIFYIYPAVIILFYLVTGKEKVGILDYLCLVSCFIGVLFIVKPEFLKAYLISTESNATILYNGHGVNLLNNTISNLTENINSISGINSTINSGIKNSIKNLHSMPDIPETLRLVLFGMVISAAIIKAGEDILVKNAGKNVHPVTYVICYALIGNVFFPALLMIMDSKLANLTLKEVVLLFFIAVTCFLYIFFMALGFHHESAGRVSMINYLQVVFVFITDILLFSKNPTNSDYIGTVLILFFNTINGIYKANKRNQKLEMIKKKAEDKRIAEINKENQYNDYKNCKEYDNMTQKDLSIGCKDNQLDKNSLKNYLSLI